MDQLLQMIQSADPTDNESDACELLQLEGRAQGPFLVMRTHARTHTYIRTSSLIFYLDLCVLILFLFFCSGACNQMGPLIDQKLEEIDRY